MSKKSIFGVILIVSLIAVVVGLFFLPGPTRSTEQPPDERTTNVRIMEVSSGPLHEWVELPASVEPLVLTEVPAEVEGRIDWIGPEEGDIIEKPGTPLLRIDQRTFRAQMEEAKAAYELSVKNCKRIEDLHAQGFVSDEQLDQCRTKLATDSARLEIVKIQLEKATVAAPIAGILDRSYFEVGEYVRQGDRVADIVVIDPVKITFMVPEKDIPYIQRGGRVGVSFDFLQGESYEGAVSYISVVGDQSTRTYKVEVTVPNPGFKILPSMIATVRTLKREIPEAIAVPLFAVIPRGDFLVVFVEKDGRAHERLVELGILEGTRVQIVKGLEPHDRLIVEGNRELADGEAVLVRGSIEASP
jgi:membrane fusion protein (multidrug efflux system)